MSKVSPLSDDYPLFLHLDDEKQVWTGRAGGRSPSRTRLDIWEFIDSANLSGSVRIVGGYENAELVSAILHHAKYNPDLKVFLGSPRLAPGGFGIQDTLHAIAAAPNYPASLGGWRVAGPVDLLSYELAECARDANCPVPLDTVRQHPLWAAAKFIPTISDEWLGRFIGNVLDPRWYIDRENPDRHSALYAYLGLRPKTFEDCLAGNMTGRNFSCWATYCCWMPRSVEVVKELDMRNPRNFLFRVFASHVARSRAVAAVRASQILVSYLRGMWLCHLAGPGQADPLFSAEQFFLREEERQAFHGFFGPL